MSSFSQGFILQASLILSLGAQNLFVFDSGLKKQRHFLVAFVSSLCDVFLIGLGVLGVATIFSRVPELQWALGLLGVVFLFVFGVMKIKESTVTSSQARSNQSSNSHWKTIQICLALSLLNPHVVLDTVVLVGGYSTKFAELSERIEFGVGAIAFSVLWFFGLSYSAAFFAKFLKGQRTMKWISLCSGVVLVLLSIKLGAEVYSWLQ